MVTLIRPDWFYFEFMSRVLQGEFVSTCRERGGEGYRQYFRVKWMSRSDQMGVFCALETLNPSGHELPGERIMELASSRCFSSLFFHIARCSVLELNEYGIVVIMQSIAGGLAVG